jgi:hypothetical protein
MQLRRGLSAFLFVITIPFSSGAFEKNQPTLRSVFSEAGEAENDSVTSGKQSAKELVSWYTVLKKRYPHITRNSLIAASSLLTVALGAYGIYAYNNHDKSTVKNDRQPDILPVKKPITPTNSSFSRDSNDSQFAPKTNAPKQEELAKETVAIPSNPVEQPTPNLTPLAKALHEIVRRNLLKREKRLQPKNAIDDETITTIASSLAQNPLKNEITKKYIKDETFQAHDFITDFDTALNGSRNGQKLLIAFWQHCKEEALLKDIYWEHFIMLDAQAQTTALQILNASNAFSHSKIAQFIQRKNKIEFFITLVQLSKEAYTELLNEKKKYIEAENLHGLTYAKALDITNDIKKDVSANIEKLIEDALTSIAADQSFKAHGTSPQKRRNK